ncbi:hypothetical protein [Fodinicola feengrottensis]|uniref:hypothetical protein n=1 Tax=Fodinicola feengrottensis TaxID=435914 RepID=UPI0031E280B4
MPLQRDVGWPKATGWNKTARTIDSKHSMVRIPLAGLAKQNQDPSPNKEKTDEEAAGEAIVWLRPDLDVSKEVLVLVHLHGLTDRSADPFAGYRENNADPKTEESAEARKVAKEKKGFVNPLAHKVRDVERDRIGQQVEAVEDESKVADRQLIAVLPQGTGKSQKKGEPPQKPGFGKNFDANATVDEVLDRLVQEKLLKGAPKQTSIVLSAHSAGGSTVAKTLEAGHTDRIGGLILFDALYGKANEKDPTKTDSPQRDQVISWVEANCHSLGRVLRDSTKTAQEKDTAVYALPGVRGYWESGYANTYRDLQARLNAVVTKEIPADFRAAVNAKFVITQVKTTHDQIIGGNATPGVSSGPMQDALHSRKDFVAPAVARQIQRKTPGGPTPAKTAATVKLTWKGELKNAAQLQPVLDRHPEDLTADIVEKGHTVETADTTATFDVPPTPASHTYTVAPKAAAPDDYYLPHSRKVAVEAGKTTEAEVTLPYNRSNVRFTERTWKVAGIDVAKGNNVKAATLFGRSVGGGLNALTSPRVAAANAWFTGNASPAEQAAATGSIVSITGQVKRTQSRGTYSNHSTGVAIDINPREDSMQNWHVKKDDKHHAKAMKLFNTVVSQPSLLDTIATALAQIVVPGVGNLSAFRNFDVWTERDRDRLLAASHRFTTFFPDYLAKLATQADPAATVAPTASTVMALSATELKALAARARAGRKADVSATLTDIADVWYEVRAWVGGFVITNKNDSNGEAKGMLRGDFDNAKTTDPTLRSKGELTGMISLHPAVVKALTEGGWSWMVDYPHDNEKDFMHFEDRTAETDLKT